MKHTLTQRLERARELRRQGHNCSQTVAMVFDDVTGLDEAIAARAMGAFGGGMAGRKSTCGVVAAMVTVDGLALYPTPAEKRQLYADASSLCDRFEQANGSLLCAHLRQPGRKTCDQLIAEGITLLHSHLESHGL